MENETLLLLEKLSVIKEKQKGLSKREPDLTELKIIHELKELYKQVKKLVIVKLDAIGDSLLFTNSIKAIRSLFPSANISLTCYLETKEIVDRCPYIDTRIYIDRNSFSVSKPYRENVLAKLPELKYDVLINPLFSREYHAEQIVAFINADIKIGIKGDLSNIAQSILGVTDKWYDYFLQVDTVKNKFELQRNAEIISLLGGNLDENLLPELWEAEEDNQFISQFLKNYQVENYAVIFPGSKGGRSSIKYWGTEKYASLIDYIQENLKLKAVVLGGVDDSEICSEIAMASKSAPVLLAGHFSLWQAVAFLKQAVFYVGADTSIAHFSAALKIPTIVILGGGHFGRFFPYPNAGHVRAVYKKMQCYNCNWKCEKTEVECIINISLAEVSSVCKEFAKKYSNGTNRKDIKQINFIKERGSKLKIDLIVPPNSNHSWHLKEGWIHSLRNRGILNNVFYVNEKYLQHFFEYLNTGGRSDIILALGGDHHLYFLNDSDAKQQLWKKYKKDKVCYSYESSNETIYESYRSRVNNAIKVFTHYLVADENDISIYKNSGKEAIWFPQFVDEKIFYQSTPFQLRQPSLFFKGKLWNEYASRRTVLKALVDSELCTISDQFLSTGELVSYYNSFKGAINPPGVFGGFNVRTFEALACGNLLFQFKPENRPLNNALFEDGKHLLYFDTKDINKLIDKVKSFVRNPETYRFIAEEGHAEVLNNHTLEKRIDTFIDWITEKKLPIYPKYSTKTSRVKENNIEDNREANGNSSVNISKKEEKSIKVSAIVSTYNSEEFIEGCIRDLVNQSLYANGELEIVIVNSGSGQNEDRIVKKYIKNYPNIIYLKTERETIYQAWNRGIKAARGQYITNANTDDRHRPDALQIMLDVFEKNSDIDVVYADIYNTVTPNDTFNLSTKKTETNWIAFDPDLILFGCFLGPQPMWKKNLHDKFGFFDEELKVVGDYEFWLRISRAAKFFHIQDKLGLYYYSSKSAEHREQFLTDKEHNIVQEKYFNAFVLTVADIERLKSKLKIIYNATHNDEYNNKALRILNKRDKGIFLYNLIVELISESSTFSMEQIESEARKVEDMINEDIIVDKIILDNYYSVMGIMYIRNRNLSKAKAYFESALERNNVNVNACLGLAEINFFEGNMEGSRKMFEHALKLEQGNNTALKGLDKIKAKMSENNFSKDEVTTQLVK